MAFNRFGQVTTYPSPEPTARMRNNQNMADVTSYGKVYTQVEDWLGQMAKSAPKVAMLATDESAVAFPSKPPRSSPILLKKVQILVAYAATEVEVSRWGRPPRFLGES